MFQAKDEGKIRLDWRQCGQREIKGYNILNGQSIILGYYLDGGWLQRREDRRQGGITRFFAWVIVFTQSMLYIRYSKQFSIIIQSARAWKWEVES